MRAFRAIPFLLLAACQTMVTKEEHLAALSAKDERIAALEAELEETRADLARIAEDAADRIAVLEREAERARKLEQEQENIRKELERFVRAGAIEIDRRPEGLALTVVDRILFDLGEAEVKPEAKALLDRIANILNSYPGRGVRIEGHTDTVPIRTARFPSNWELSTARAHAVRRYLTEQGVSPERIAVTGYGEFRPIAPNDTPEGRAKNRRVEVILLDPEG